MTASSSLLAAPHAAELIRRALDSGDTEAADRLIAEAISRIILAPEDAQIPDLILAEPGSTGSERYDVLLGTGFAFALSKRGLPCLDWMTAAPALDSEWLWDGDTAGSSEFRDFIRRETPRMFQEKNILLRERDLIAP